MDLSKKALPAEGAAKPAQIPAKIYETAPRDRLFLGLTAVFCVLLADSFLWHGPTAGLGLSVFLWCALTAAYVGPKTAFAVPANRFLLTAILLLAATFALGSNWYFRLWNCLALLVLLPIHAIGVSGAGRLPWHCPAMLWERFCLLLSGLLCNLGVNPAVLSSGKGEKRRPTLPLILGGCGAAALVAVLLPVLASADALFAAATADLRQFLADHFSTALQKLLWGLAFTPFVFGLLYSLRHPKPLSRAWRQTAPALDAIVFALMLAALDALYLLFLAVQSAGLFGGPAYLAEKGLSYAEWARSGFFQMVGVTAVNLAVTMLALTLSRRQGRSWGLLRLLAALLAAESLVLLASACWRMTLYVTAYGLSFKRCMTYWGMGMMALFLLAALWKVRHPDFAFCRLAFPLALAGWLAVNCVPIDYLVAKNQVDRYLGGESASIDIEYLAYELSYDTLSQLDRLDGHLICLARTGHQQRLEALLAGRRADARAECADWHTWSLSACLAAGQRT